MVCCERICNCRRVQISSKDMPRQKNIIGRNWLMPEWVNSFFIAYKKRWTWTYTISFALYAPHVFTSHIKDRTSANKKQLFAWICTAAPTNQMRFFFFSMRSKRWETLLRIILSHYSDFFLIHLFSVSRTKMQSKLLWMNFQFIKPLCLFLSWKRSSPAACAPSPYLYSGENVMWAPRVMRIIYIKKA